MPIDLIIPITILSFILGGFFGLIAIYDKIKIWRVLLPIIFFLSLMFMLWIAVSGCIPWEVEKTYLARVYKVENKDIVFVDGNWINLNYRFGRSFQDGDCVNIIIYKDKTYGGIWYHLPRPEIEILEIQRHPLAPLEPVEFDKAA